MKFRAKAWRTALALVGSGGVACGPPAVTEHAPAPVRYTATGAIDPGVVPDTTIKAVLERQLKGDGVVSAEHIGVDVEDGIVTLEATVATQIAKERAVAITQIVRGVRATIDRIDVAEHPHEDHQLDVVVAGILSADPVTSGQRIAARAHDGVVSLSGEVDSYATRQITEDDVLGIPGVLRVTDDMAVFPRKTSDARMTETVKRFLGDDPWLDDAHVNVSTSNDHVTLGGFVDSDEEKVRAENDAHMACPRGLDASGLRVDPWTGDGTLRAKPPLMRGDRDIGQAILDAYVDDPRVHPFAPAIDVRDRVVILTGIAPNAEAKQAALEDASNTAGVADVRDDMKLMPALAHRSDPEIRTEVVDSMMRDARLRRLHLAVDVVDGRVYLRGTVHSEADRLHAIALATSAPGARNIEDGLVLEPKLGAASMQR
jgi:osmotically-inducible protein OsmY